MENKKIFPPLAIGIILTLAIFIGGFFWLQNQPKFGPGGMPIQIYEECVAAGNPVMETYPPQCRTKDGKIFTQQIQSKDTCGNGTCENVACMAIGCPQPETSENCPADCQAAPVDDLSGWQTYRNEEFGFEFKYPEEWSLQEGTAIKDDFDFIHIGSIGPLNINMVDKELNASNIQGVYGKVDNERIEVIKVGGVDSYMFRDGDAGCGGNIVQIPNNKQIINLGFIDCDKNTEAEDNRVAILSTFKFIN